MAENTEENETPNVPAVTKADEEKKDKKSFSPFKFIRALYGQIPRRFKSEVLALAIVVGLFTGFAGPILGILGLVLANKLIRGTGKKVATAYKVATGQMPPANEAAGNMPEGPSNEFNAQARNELARRAYYQQQHQPKRPGMGI